MTLFFITFWMDNYFKFKFANMWNLMKSTLIGWLPKPILWDFLDRRAWITIVNSFRFNERFIVTFTEIRRIVPWAGKFGNHMWKHKMKESYRLELFTKISITCPKCTNNWRFQVELDLSHILDLHNFCRKWPFCKKMLTSFSTLTRSFLKSVLSLEGKGLLDGIFKKKEFLQNLILEFLLKKPQPISKKTCVSRRLFKPTGVHQRDASRPTILLAQRQSKTFEKFQLTTQISSRRRFTARCDHFRLATEPKL